MNVFNIKNAIELTKIRHYLYIFWAIDLHGVIFKPDFKKDGPVEFYDGAIEVLQNITMHPKCKIIIYSAVQPHLYERYAIAFKENNIHIDYINENPECVDTMLSDFSKKIYFSILLEDKAGFEGDTDWFLIKTELQKLDEWIY